MAQKVDYLVVGGGISGLTTAHELKKRGRDVLLLEAGSLPGGNIQTRYKDGWLVEEGPNSLLVNRQQVLDLIREIGLDDEIAPGSEISNNRFILRDGHLMALPGSPLSFLRTSLFSFSDKVRLFKEPFISRAEHEETVAEFVIRRLGKGFYDYAINPFVSGVYAGDPHKLSARAATKKVYALEEKHGSLVRGALAMVLGRDRPEGRISGRMLSFKQGLARLPLKLADVLGDRVQLSSPVQTMRYDKEAGSWAVEAGQSSYQAKHVVLSTPSVVSANLLRDEVTLDALKDIQYVPIAVCHFGFRKDQIDHALNGFGCLVPRKEGIRLLGTLFSSSMFPGRCPDDEHVLLTCFIGGATFTGIKDWSDEKVQEQVSSDLYSMLGIQSEPVFKNTVRYDRSIPQYTMGHLERMAGVQKEIAALPRLSTRANWHDGISVSDCILNSINHGRNLN